MKKVLLRGPLLTSSGYGEHARQFFRWLETRGDIDLKVQCLNWGMTTWYINPDLESGLIGRIMEKTNFDISKEDFDISIQIQLPDEWDPSLAKMNIGVSAFMETDRTSYEWFKACEKMDKIIAPSKHSLESVLIYGDPKVESHVVNEPYNPLLLKEDLSFNIDFKTNFNFLIVSQLTDTSSENDRKNIVETIKNFCKIFKNDKDVGLVIKTNLGRSTTKDRNNTKSVLKSIIDKCREGEFPRVYMVHGLMTPGEMCALYRNKKIKGLISLTKGEGYGLPILEASVLGLPVIATNWSGHLDFLNTFTEIDFKIKEIPKAKVDNRIFVQGMRWAIPNMNDFADKIVKFKKEYSNKKKAAKKQSKINVNKFSQSMFNKRMNEILS
jgi:glycosyltransferase involved in cell wall biosynthesis